MVGVEVKMGSYMSGGDKKVATRTQRGDAPIENRYQVLKIGLDAATLKKINDSSSNSQTAIDELKIRRTVISIICLKPGKRS